MGTQNLGFLLSLTTRKAAPARPIRDAAGMALWVAICCAAPLATVWTTGSSLEKLKRAWTIEGPPCEEIEAMPDRLISRRRPAQAFTYAGAHYVHASGMAFCAELAAHPWWPVGARVAVCQFNNPVAVTVRTRTGPATFLAPPGRRLTVSVRSERASCVVGGWFAL